MASSAIYTANTSAPVVTANSTLPMGGVIRRFGCGVQYNGNSISLSGSGYYLVNVSATMLPTVAGAVTLALLDDGVVVTGATATGTATAANDAVPLSLTAMIRRRCACDDAASLTLTTSTAGVLENLAVTVVKV